MNDIQSESTIILFDGRNDKFRFYHVRLLVQTFWYLIIFGVPTILLYKNDGHLALSILIPFIILWLFTDYLSERRFRYTTVFITLDIKTQVLSIENIDRKAQLQKMLFALNDIDIKLKKLMLGQISVPNYELVIQSSEGVKYRQKGNYVLSTSRIKEIAEKLKAYQTDNDTTSGIKKTPANTGSCKNGG